MASSASARAPSFAGLERSPLANSSARSAITAFQIGRELPIKAIKRIIPTSDSRHAPNDEPHFTPVTAGDYRRAEASRGTAGDYRRAETSGGTAALRWPSLPGKERLIRMCVPKATTTTDFSVSREVICIHQY